MKLVEGGPIELVPMDWVCGFEKLVIISLMYMPHFGRTAKVNTSVKQLLVCLHGFFLWVDNHI